MVTKVHANTPGPDSRYTEKVKRAAQRLGCETSSIDERLFPSAGPSPLSTLPLVLVQIQVVIAMRKRKGGNNALSSILHGNQSMSASVAPYRAKSGDRSP